MYSDRYTYTGRFKPEKKVLLQKIMICSIIYLEEVIVKTVTRRLCADPTSQINMVRGDVTS